MRTLLLLGCLLCLAVSRPAGAAAFRPFEDSRYITSLGIRCSGGPEGDPPCVQTGETGPAQGSTDFDDPFEASTQLPGIVATQSTRYTATGLEGRGDISLSLEDYPDHFALADSGWTARFFLDEAALVTIHAEIEFSANLLGALQSGEFLTVDFSYGAFVQDSRHIEMRGRFPVDHDSASFSFEEILAPGMYQISVEAHGEQHHAQVDFATASWSVDLTATAVPEQTSLLLTGAGLLGIALSRAAARSRAGRAPSRRGRASR